MFSHTTLSKWLDGTLKEKHNKAKPSELNTQSLSINNFKIENQKITTKIHYGKKQFVFELASLSDNADKLKKKIEIRFKDIEKIEIQTDNSTLTLCIQILISSGWDERKSKAPPT